MRLPVTTVIICNNKWVDIVKRKVIKSAYGIIVVLKRYHIAKRTGGTGLINVGIIAVAIRIYDVIFLTCKQSIIGIDVECHSPVGIAKQVEHSLAVTSLHQ